MNCPYCKTKMEKGELSTYAMFNPLTAATIKFIPENKSIGKKKADSFSTPQGWYCIHCHKIIGIFST